MDKRLATALGLLLIACGAIFVGYAAISMRSAASLQALSSPPVSNSATAVSEPAATPAVTPSPLGEGGLEEKRAGEGLTPETVPSPATASEATTATAMPPVAAVPASSVAAVAAAPARHPPDSSDSADRTAARRQAAIMWILIALPLVFITFVLMIVLRRLRPPPMKHTGPSDTTDLWQEAGRRMK